MVIYVLCSKSDDYGVEVNGTYSTKEKTKEAFEDLLRANFYNGFSEFCSEDEDWNGELNPWVTPINGENLQDVLSGLYYENDAGEWISVTETKLDA